MLAKGSVASRNPARPGEVVWHGDEVVEHATRAIDAARAALPEWSRWSIDRREGVLRRFARLCSDRVDAMATLIADEVGKPAWDARAEAQLLAAKVDVTLEHGPWRARVAPFEVALGPTRVGRCDFRPHGVMGVIGPFNFPAHLPNGHIVPALLMGNTVVFKPSEKAPGVGQTLVELLVEALDGEAAPPGVVNLVHGGASVATRIAAGEGVDGVLFTGSWPVGRRIMEANLDRPGRLLALEMGGSNPAVIMPDADLKLAAVECVRAAFVTAGQRCTCTRRVIVHQGVAGRVIPALCKAAGALVVGGPDDDGPVFMGPLISEAARAAVLAAQAEFAARGGEVLLACRPLEREGWFLTPGVTRVERFTRGGPTRSAGDDVEVFGPLLRVSVASSLDDAIAQANATDFGLAASIFTRDQDAANAFLAGVRAGCVNVNAGTAGASGKLPFGGLGRSGNHRPAGSWSLDYCAYPRASMVESGHATPSPGMTFDDAWLE